MHLPENINTALEMLGNAGFEAYVVGGCVRDSLLYLQPNDYDITTSASPLQIKEVFKEYNTIDTGIAHGTVTVVINSAPIEITTFRCDGTYSDNRRPDYVTFTTSLEEDLARRDFTVNAMCYNPKSGVIDLFCGQTDIENALIRTVGEPKKRFEEDSLRILRGLRFSAQFGFDIEENTANAMLSCRSLLKNVAAERVTQELNKLLCGKNAYRVLMGFYEIFIEIIPEFKGAKGFSQHSPYHIYDIWQHTAVAVNSAPANKITRIATFLHDIGKLYTFSLDENGVGHFYNHANVSVGYAKDILERLKYDNVTKESVLQLIKYHDLVIENNEVQIKRLLSKLGKEQFFRLMDIKKADTLAQSSNLVYRLDIADEIINTANRILKESQCFSLKDMAVNGNHIKALGFNGKEIGEILSILLEKVIANELPNSKDELLNYVTNLKKLAEE